MTLKHQAVIPDHAALEAVEADRRARALTVPLKLTTEEIATLDTAIPDILELARDAGQIFHFFSYRAASGTIDPEDPVIQAFMRMSARAVRSMEDREFHALDMLDLHLHSAAREAREGGAA